MNNRHLQQIGAAGPRVDGIVVAQLLRDLGEASAASSAVDLFGLCLNAQRVLACMHAGGAHLKPAEAGIDAESHGGAERVHAHPAIRLTDADYAAMAKRYEDAGDTKNADIIRRQWEVARRAGGIAGSLAEHGSNQHQNEHPRRP